MNITEEILFENDGSGLWTMQVDFIEMIELMTLDDEELFNGINWEKGVDTIIDLKEFQDADWDISEMNTDVFKDMQVSMKLNSSKSIALLNMEYPFRSLEDLNRVLVDFNRDMSSEPTIQAGPLGAGGKFRRRKNKYFREAIALDLKSAPTNDDSDEIYNSFIGEIEMKSIYHFPKKIRKVNIKSAIIEGKTLTVVFKAEEIMNSGMIPPLEVKLKK